jgi:phage RecT family recombinase
LDFNDYLNDVWYAVSNSKELQTCTPESIFDAALQAAASGLTIGNNKANLVPRAGKVKFEIGYEGQVELLKRVAKIKTRDEDVIREGDKFSWSFNKKSTPEGLKAVAEYEIEKNASAGRKIIGAYCYVMLEDGNSYIRYMDRAQISLYQRDTVFWKTWEDKMALKTVIRELTKVLYKRYDNKSNILEVLTADDVGEFMDEPSNIPLKPALTLCKAEQKNELPVSSSEESTLI